MKLTNLAFRNMRRNLRRTILSTTAIAIAALCFVFLFSLIAGMKDDVRTNLVNHYNGQVRIRHNEYDKYEQLNPLFLGIEDQTAVTTAVEEALPGAYVSPKISFPAAIYLEEENLASLGQGVDFEREKVFQNLEDLMVLGRLPEMGSNEVLLTPGLYNDTGVTLGDTLTFFTQTRGRGANGFSLTVVGVAKFPVQSFNKMTFLAPLDRIQYYLRMGDSVTEVLIRNVEEDGRTSAALLNGIFERRGWNDITALGWMDIPGGVFGWLAMAEQAYNFMGLIFFLLGATVIVNTTMMVIFERTKEIGTVAAMGMTGKQIVKLFFLEALFISIIGSLIGVILGSILTIPLGNVGLNMQDAMEGISMEVSGIFYPVLSWGIVIKVFVFSTVIASLASFVPSRRAAKINPIEALRSE